MNEQDKFLKDLESGEEKTILDLPLEPEKVEEAVEKDDEPEFRNRRERRLAAKLQQERESSIRLAERLATLSEAQKSKEDASEDYLRSVEKIYGTDTPEAVAATELLKSALKGVAEKSKREALEEWRLEQRKAKEEEQKELETLDNMVDELEDTYNVELTPTQKKGYFQLLEKMSPKDENGHVIAYADPNSVWDVFQERIKKTDNRAKELSNRSMVQSGASQGSKLTDDSHARYLRENGII